MFVGVGLGFRVLGLRAKNLSVCLGSSISITLYFKTLFHHDPAWSPGIGVWDAKL